MIIYHDDLALHRGRSDLEINRTKMRAHAFQEKCFWPMFIAALIYVLLDGASLVLFRQLLSIAFCLRTPRLVFILGLIIFIEGTGFRMHRNKMRYKF